ncbi:MAG: tetratricopeptide repeat protein [Chitinivibrionales bacterium]|nr:tetratricopeptide repeat protein [Chitinivibrionales bacterium]
MMNTNCYTRKIGVVLLLVAGMISSISAAGLPGEYLITQRWRDLLSPYSPLTNPALLTEANYITARGAFAPTLGNSFKLGEIGVTVPIGLYQSVSVSWIGLGSGQFSGYTWDNDEQTMKKTDGEISSQHNFFMLSYAINPWNRLSTGVNVNFAHESLFGEEQRFSPMPGIDFGISYRAFRHPVIGNHLFGLTFQNILAPTLKSDVEELEGDVYSRNLKLSWLATFWEKRISSGMDFDIKDWLTQADEFKEVSNEGLVDAASKVEWELSYRLGFWLLRIFKLYGQFGLSDKPVEGNELPGYWGFAGGFNMPSVNNGRDVEFLYQYNSMFEGDNISTHTIYGRAEFGLHREEIYARRMARMLDASPNDLYNKALTLYHQEKYWDAFFVFGQILSQFPDFFKNDWVNYYLHSCQEELDMRQTSWEGYNDAISKYPQSEIVPYADLGIMRVAYREGDDVAVTTQFNRLNAPAVPDSLKYHAFYIMGQVHAKKKEHAKAIQLFENVPEYHPDYVFAQHSLAVTYMRQDKSTEATEALENAIQTEAKREDQRECVNRSLLLIGYVFYEELSLSKAVTALRKIPNSSYFYEDALLGLGWTGVKARQWADCAQAGQALQRTSNKIAVQAEGALLEAYSAMMKKSYDEAANILRQALNKIEDYDGPPEDSLTLRKEKYQRNREQYETVAQSAEELALVRQTSLVLRMIDSLHIHQKEEKQAIEDFLTYTDEFERRSFFSQGIDKVKSDIEYALATAEKLSEGTSVAPKQEIEKQKELDMEIEKLKEEMKKLEEDGQ